MRAWALAGSRATQRGLPWYCRLNKPPFQPPTWLFAPVWTVLYAAIAISGWRVYRQPRSLLRRRALRLWGAQIGLNGMWSWLFVGGRMTWAALADCLLLSAPAGAYVRVARQIDRSAARLFLPYVAWVGFATRLNQEVVRRNPTVRSAASSTR